MDCRIVAVIGIILAGFGIRAKIKGTSSVGIIGGADGPTAIFVAGKVGDATVFEPHQEDFSSVIEDSVLEQFEADVEVKKAYILRTNDWFLSEGMSDFSQAVTTDSVYVVPGGDDGTDTDRAYSFYKVNEEREIEWNGSAYPPADATLPFGFSGLTYEMIESVLGSMEYEDYIITYAQRLNIVFVWVRCEKEDLIITYPTRLDLLGLEVGKIYTLEEVKGILAEAYNR